MKISFLFIALLASVSALAGDCDCGGQQGYEWTNNRHKNPSKGGCVSHGAYMDESVFLARTAKVCGDNIISGNAKIVGNAIIYGTAEINGKNIFIGRDARVGGTAKIFDNVRIVSKTITSGTHRNTEMNGIIDQNNQDAADRKAAQEAEERRKELERKKAQEEAARKAKQRKEDEINKLQDELQAYRKANKRLYDFYFYDTCKLRSYDTDSSYKYRVNLSTARMRKVTNNSTANWIGIYFHGEPVYSEETKDYYDEIGIEMKWGTSSDLLEGKLTNLVKTIISKCRNL